MTSSKTKDNRSVVSEPTPNATDDAKNAPLDGPVATTYEEALDVGYFGGPSDDTDYSVAASVPEPQSTSKSTKSSGD